MQYIFLSVSKSPWASPHLNFCMDTKLGDRKAVMRFLGMAGYYRRFCPNFAVPFANLDSPKKFLLTDECQVAYENICALLTSAPVLQPPNFNEPFCIHVDASDVGAGGGVLLVRLGLDSVLHPVCYNSVKFKKHQLNHSTIEKEALSLLSALEKFTVYLSNSHHQIVVYSDHNPFCFLEKMKNNN